MASTWAALSQLQPRWPPHVAGRTRSGRIRCGSARSGQACAKGCGHTGVWAGVRRKNPTGFWAKRQVFDVLPQRLAGRKRSHWR
jgi:hypothetical protein